MTAQFWWYDGDQPVPITKRELNDWIVRTRVGAAQFRYAAEQGDLRGMADWAGEAAGCGAELQNIAEATAQMRLSAALDQRPSAWTRLTRAQRGYSGS